MSCVVELHSLFEEKSASISSGPVIRRYLRASKVARVLYLWEHKLKMFSAESFKNKENEECHDDQVMVDVHEEKTDRAHDYGNEETSLCTTTIDAIHSLSSSSSLSTLERSKRVELPKDSIDLALPDQQPNGLDRISRTERPQTSPNYVSNSGHLIISWVVLENFKSYGGRHIIGPFHRVRNKNCIISFINRYSTTTFH